MSSSKINTKASHYSRRWLGVVSCLVLFIISGTGLVFWRLQTVQILSVQTNSMAPEIRPGDAVIVHQTSTIRVGDIVSYHSPLNPAVIVTHRVVSSSSTTGEIVTRGDNTTRTDSPINKSLIIGTVNYHVIKLGYALNFLRSPAGLLVGVYLPATIIVGIELRRLSTAYAEPTYRLASR